MKKNLSQFFVFLASAVLVLHLTACTPTKSDGDDANSDSASLENPEGSDKPKSDEAQAGFLDDQLPEDSLGKPKDQAKADSLPPAPAEAGSKDGDLGLDAPAASNPPADMFADKGGSSPSLTPDPSSSLAPDAMAKTEDPKPDTGSSVGSTTDAGAPKAASAPLQKVKEAPFQQGGHLLNTVYVARPGDTFKSISSMVYGNPDHVKDLKASNPGMKTGPKNILQLADSSR